MNSLLPDPSASLLDRIKCSMVGLKMPRAIEVVDDCVNAPITPPALIEPRRRGRPPKNGGSPPAT